MVQGLLSLHWSFVVQHPAIEVVVQVPLAQAPVLHVSPGQSPSLQQAAQTLPQTFSPGGQAVQRGAPPAPPSVQIKPSQQVWFPPQACPSPRQARSAPAVAAPGSVSSAEMLPPATPVSSRRRDVPIASTRAIWSKR